MSDLMMEAPPLAVYSSFDELLQGAQQFATAHGYKLVVVRSKTNAAGQKTWVHLACDRHGIKRNTHGLTPETRKKNRRSRRCECPMYCVAAKSTSDLWELSTRNPEHNHPPYEPPQPKKKDLPKPHASELVNLPALQTPSSAIADFSLVPIGTGSASVSNEVAEVHRLLRRSGISHHLGPDGTTIEGSWDEITNFIGKAHSLLHGTGVVRIKTDIRISSRTDKKQKIDDKVASVQHLLDGIPDEENSMLGSDETMGDEAEVTMPEVDTSIADNIDPNIQPGLEQHRVMATPQIHTPLQANMGHPMHHHVQAQMAQHGQSQMPHTPQQHNQMHSPHPLSGNMQMQ